MNFARQQRDPRRHIVGFAAVIALHAAIVYALVTGLAKKVVDVVRAPIETKVIEELKKPPPPPEIVVPPPPRLEAPPPPFIPPPEVVVTAPPPPPTVSLAPTPTPPPAPVEIKPAPPAPVAPAPPAPAPPTAPPAPPPPKPATAEAYCVTRPKPEIPGVDFTGRIAFTMKATISNGKMSKIELVPGSFSGTSDRKVQRAFVNVATAALQDYGCDLGPDHEVLQQFGFTIN